MQDMATFQLEWQQMCQQLSDQLKDLALMRWMSRVVPEMADNNRLNVWAPSPCICELVQMRYGEAIRAWWQNKNPNTSVFVGIKKMENTPAVQPIILNKPLIATPKVEKATPAKVVNTFVEDDLFSQFLDKTHTFDSFVVGPSNEFAYVAAKQIADDDTVAFNPLYLQAGVGLGKTHLMHAIAWRIKEQHPEKTVLYLSSEQFLQRFLRSLQNKDMNGFKELFRNVDVLLVDDIQFIEGKKKTMDQMQHTFDSLYNKGKQIVITSDRLPKDIPNLTAALDSRFAMGLMIELTAPDEITRYEIIYKLANDNGLVFEKEALKYIAKNFTKNVRELEGAFNKVSAYAELTEQPLSLKLAKEVLKCDDFDSEISFQNIAKVTAEYYNVDINDIIGTARGQKVSLARHLAVYLARELTEKSFVSIAEFYNKKHTTIMFAHEKIKKEIVSNKEISLAAREIKQALKVM